jgi:site-specific recombinase XerD
MRTGKAFRHRALAEFIKVRLRAHGLANVNIHQLRASAATHMVNAGMKIGYAQHILGHQQLTTTKIYIHIRQDELKRRLAQAHPREAMEKRISIQGGSTK